MATTPFTNTMSQDNLKAFYNLLMISSSLDNVVLLEIKKNQEAVAMTSIKLHDHATKPYRTIAHSVDSISKFTPFTL